MEFTLQPEEAKLFARILAEYLSDMRMEITKTEKYEWRESLKQEEVMIKAMLVRLDEGKVQAA